MQQRINREYVLSVNEVKTALWDFLRKTDRPVPGNPGVLEFKWNAPGEAFVSYGEVLEFDS